jgi:hypothetical protein
MIHASNEANWKRKPCTTLTVHWAMAIQQQEHDLLWKPSDPIHPLEVGNPLLVFLCPVQIQWPLHSPSIKFQAVAY